MHDVGGELHGWFKVDDVAAGARECATLCPRIHVKVSQIYQGAVKKRLDQLETSTRMLRLLSNENATLIRIEFITLVDITRGRP